jgi:UDPglucose 6-dehydrogenase
VVNEAMRSVGVVGLGVVGRTVADAMGDSGVQTVGYDSYLDIGAPEDLAECDLVFLCVSTMSSADGTLEHAEVWSALQVIEPHLHEGAVVAIKSTVAPGTCDLLGAKFPRLEVVSLPEFLVADRPRESFTNPHRIVIGTRSPEAAGLLTELLSRVAPVAPVVVVLPIEAELIKLCSNAMLAAKVTMANELAGVCRRYGVSWSRVQGVVGLDTRIGSSHLTVTSEGGFGGACLPKDLDGLIAAAEEAGYDAEFLRAIATFNRRIRAIGDALETAGAVAGPDGHR